MPLKLNDKAAAFASLPIEERRKIVAEWVVSTLDETMVRKKATSLFGLLYRQEPLGFAAHENSYIHVVCGDQRANTHKPME